MNFSWLAVFLLAIFAVAVSADKCSGPFTKLGNQCVADRPIRGDCPHHSQYSARINKCVYKK